MKQFFLILALVMGYCMAASAEKIKLVPSADDSTRMDTVVVSNISDVDDASEEADVSSIILDNNDWFDGPTAAMALITIVLTCGLPLFIVAIVLIFRYKNKQAKYRLAAEALAKGQDIPKELFNEPEDQNHKILSKGIKNIFLGIGLGVFLWILTDETGLAAIGFLIFCMGLGQIIIAYTTRPQNKREE